VSAVFPSAEWLDLLKEKLNTDERYAQIASKWEGDLCFLIEPQGNLKEGLIMYLDLWHGKCRGVGMDYDLESGQPAFVLKAPYENFTKILLGELDPLQAMMTRKLHVQGSMAYMMRNVPTVLDFVRCAREVTSQIL
jgi:putative sterol carrier protein